MTELDPEAAETPAPQPERLYRLGAKFYYWHIYPDCQTLKAAATRIARRGLEPPQAVTLTDREVIASAMVKQIDICLRCRRRWERGRR